MMDGFTRRIYEVTGYTGADDLPKALANSLHAAGVVNSETPGSYEGSLWVVACACMTPHEYERYGKHGERWCFIQGRMDMAERCLEIKRKVVQHHANRMGLACDWTRIASAQRQAA